MHLKYIKIIFLLLILSIGCSEKKYSGAQDLDIIPFIRVYNGDSTTISLSDLFYSDSYDNIAFRNYDGISVRYDTLKSMITVKVNNSGNKIAFLPFLFKDAEYIIPLKVENLINNTFAFKPGFAPDIISVFGSFNNWNRNEHFMKDPNVNGIYTVDLGFDPGRYEYKFYVDGVEYLDPNNPDSLPNGLGGFNSILSVDPEFPGKEPFLFPDNVYSRDNGRIDIHFTIAKGDLIIPLNKTHVFALFDNKNITDKNMMVFDDGNKIVISLHPKEFDTEGLHRIRCVFANHKVRSNVAEIFLNNGSPLLLKNDRTVWNDAVIYSLMVDRFYNGNPDNDNPVKHDELADRANFNGGDLEGLAEKLTEGYFNRLGVNTLWISPIQKTTDKAFQETPEPHRWFTGYHGYWPVDPKEVEPRFGSNDILKDFLNKAHKNGIWVLKDFVSNHVHEEHPYFQNNREWFGMLDLPDGRKNLRLWDEHRLTTWFDPYIPSYDFLGSDEPLKVVTDDAIWWLENYRFDGFRHDAVKHVPNEFWHELTRKIKMNFPDRQLYQIGETFGDYDLVSSYVSNGQLDAQFNFNLYWPARYAYVTDSSDFRNLDREMRRSLDYYGQLHVMGNMMDSHDQPRFAAYADGDLRWDEDATEAGWVRDIQVNRPRTYKLINLYMTYLLTTPGVPIIYYGDEIGMTGGGDPDNRRMMRWGKDVKDVEKELRMQISRLIDIRNTHSALRYGVFYTVKADQNTFAYLRRDPRETVLIVTYRNAKPGVIELELPSELNIQQAQSIYGSDIFTLSDNLININSEAYQGHIFLLK